jgi:bifunctional non-homologous end joining protein LigD
MPKGPTLDPAVKSLAVHVEDHPIEYLDFEGVIPGGQYGAGDVIVWDRGVYDVAGDGDPASAIARGELHFDLHGEKLRGRFVLVRTRRDRTGKEQWLMLHKHDDAAEPGWSPDDHPESVKSGRTNEEVAERPDSMWRSDLPPAEAETPVVGAESKGKANSTARPKSSGRATTPQKNSSHPRDAVATGGARREGLFTPPTKAELDALDALGNGGEWEFQGRSLKLTNLNKELFPGRGADPPATKRDLVRYHAEISPVMLPYLVDRPVNLHRFPNGVGGSSFWHKQLPGYAPEWITRWRNAEARPGETDTYAVVDSPPSLAWMANYGAIELHPWTSRLPNVHEPTWALIDIDPGEQTTFADVVVLARLFRSGLEHLGVEGLPKLTGRRGIHIWVPIAPGYTFDQTRAWVERLSRAVGATVPDLVSWTWEKRRRHGLARLDFTQNAINKTLVAPYSARAAPGAPVSVPIEWHELDDPDLRSDTWTMRSVLKRIAEVGDPFARLETHRQRLPDL